METIINRDEVDRDFKKTIDVITSCETHEQLESANNMIHLFKIKWAADSWVWVHTKGLQELHRVVTEDISKLVSSIE